MLLIQCLTCIMGFLLLIPSLVSTLPIQQGHADDKLFANRRMTSQELQQNQQSWFTPLDIEDSTTSLEDDHGEDIDIADFYVDLNRFSQLLSAHIMAEHLDSAVNTLSKKLAAEIQNSIQLIIHPYDSTAPQQRQQPWNYQNNNKDEDVDVQLLIEQLEGAVGSYVEDQLPTLWYHHRSFAALDSVSLRSFMEQTILTHCPLIATGHTSSTDERNQHQQHRYINHQCLQPFAKTFSTTVDNFVKQHMQSTLLDIIQDDLPQLLIMTDNHIRAILNHFNTFLLSAHTQLSTNLLSLQDYQHAAAWYSSSNIDSLTSILDTISDGENKADILIHSIHQYAVLAKISLPDI